MGRNEKTRQIILRLKEVKLERSLTDPQIHRMVSDKGYSTSLSSVVRVFAEGSEDRGFRYEDTIQPIAATLLETDEPPKEVTGLIETEAEALRQLVQLKNAIISEMQIEVENVRADKEEIRAEAQKKISHLVEEGKRKDRLLDERRDFIYSKDKAIRGRNWLIFFLSMALLLCLGVIIAALVVDKFNPDIGFFWLDDMAAKVFAGKGLANIPSGSLFKF